MPMKVRKAVINAAGAHQRTLPLQTLIDRDGVEKPILRIIFEEVLSAEPGGYGHAIFRARAFTGVYQ
jgi:UTP-glucose-1-phosphate uridylyltransferase